MFLKILTRVTILKSFDISTIQSIKKLAKPLTEIKLKQNLWCDYLTSTQHARVRYSVVLNTRRVKQNCGSVPLFSFLTDYVRLH